LWTRSSCGHCFSGPAQQLELLQHLHASIHL
jgi:hypothetical protein